MSYMATGTGPRPKSPAPDPGSASPTAAPPENPEAEVSNSAVNTTGNEFPHKRKQGKHVEQMSGICQTIVTFCKQMQNI